uniref:Reverse transcriptase domain-containing protein n=1 Tax=Tanacetum cinerariifolium TaxID=118510 RepID=A0A699GTZ7_TANCI|nr:hypothetical protein [Tanacetum cinerariifolium]
MTPTSTFSDRVWPCPFRGFHCCPDGEVGNKGFPRLISHLKRLHLPSDEHKGVLREAISTDHGLYMAVEKTLKVFNQWLCGKCMDSHAVSRACHHPDGLVRFSKGSDDMSGYIVGISKLSNKESETEITEELVFNAERLDRVFKVPITTVKCIPHGYRLAFSQALKTVLCKVVAQPDYIDVWVKLLLFSRCTLRVYRPKNRQVRRSGNRKSLQQSFILKSLTMWGKDDDITILVKSILDGSALGSFGQGGEIDSVFSCIKSFPKGTSCERDGLRAQHILDALCGEGSATSTDLLKVITSVINLWLVGKCPPILAEFVAMKGVGQEMSKYLSDFQFGVGESGGAEAILHSVNQVLSEYHNDGSLAMLIVDFSNAFNLVDRSALLHEVRVKCPSISLWVDFLYGQASILYIGDTYIWSATGVQQGDPLGPLLFALILHPLLHKIRDKQRSLATATTSSMLSSSPPNPPFPTNPSSSSRRSGSLPRPTNLRIRRSSRFCCKLLLHVWYLDDGTVIGDSEEVSRVLDIIKVSGPGLGLELNIKKTEIFWPSCNGMKLHEGLFPVDIQRSSLGVKLLGGAVTRDADFISGLAMRRAANAVDLMGLPQTCQPVHIDEAALFFDKGLRGSIENILVYVGPFFRDLQWRLSSLPIRFGGLGLYSAKLVSSYPFVASRAQSWVLQDHILCDSGICGMDDDYVSTLACLRDTIPSFDVSGFTNKDIVPSKAQQTLADVFFSEMVKDMEVHFDITMRQKAVLKYRTILKYRLMISLFSVDAICPVCRKTCLDSFGEHAVHCKELSGFKYRHDMVKDILFDICRRAGISAKKEAPVNFLTDSSDVRCTLRPADVLVFGWVGGKHACVDLANVSPLVGLSSRGFTAGQAALKAASGKVTKHDKAFIEN